MLTLYVGPPWDFDAGTFGIPPRENMFYTINSGLYIPQMMKDSVFRYRLKEKWEMYKDIWKYEIPKFVDNQFNLLYKSAIRNEEIWKEGDGLDSLLYKS